MSESRISKEWPTTKSLEEHTTHLGNALDATRTQMWLPDTSENPMWDYAQALLSLRGRTASVLAMGTPGGGKTLWGDVVVGGRSEKGGRIEVTADDTLATLVEGYLRPTDGEFNPGRISINPEYATIFLNEIAHLGDNPQALNALYEAVVSNNQRLINTSDVAFYGTGNHPSQGSRRSRKLDEALRSRQAMSLEVSVTPEQAAERTLRLIEDEITGAAESRTLEGFLPNVTASRAFLAATRGIMKVRGDVGLYNENLIIALNQLGVFEGLEHGDGRNPGAFARLYMARRLVELAKPTQEKDAEDLVKPPASYQQMLSSNPNIIAPYGLSTIASLRLGHIAVLDGNQSRRIEQGLTPNGRQITARERSILGRRIIAAAAYLVAHEMDVDRSRQPISEDEIRARIDRFSYVYPDNGMREQMDNATIKLVKDAVDPSKFIKKSK